MLEKPPSSVEVLSSLEREPFSSHYNDLHARFF